MQVLSALLIQLFYNFFRYRFCRLWVLTCNQVAIHFEVSGPVTAGAELAPSSVNLLSSRKGIY